MVERGKWSTVTPYHIAKTAGCSKGKLTTLVLVHSNGDATKNEEIGRTSHHILKKEAAHISSSTRENVL